MVLAATEQSIAAAAGHLTPMDAGALEALRRLATMIDFLFATGGMNAEGKLDNVSIPTYLKFCDALGLTPAGRVKLDDKKEPAGGKLAQLRSVAGGKH